MPIHITLKFRKMIILFPLTPTHCEFLLSFRSNHHWPQKFLHSKILSQQVSMKYTSGNT